ncbi:E3 ubiquitin-protein ligase PUB23-like protein [Cinnamomum micranthum f. kanehirae]|uniref:U-box domain-containing protein n=1 Tax=Cinnamomum micranthum f. kanehirae TaxID=337451 RepID=A0A3S3Q7I2_9MAGN|nr:E3 ubiquitin-protein ligase PUB23-like protein [Cinnamomum micranthum f. kanehirae]
MEGPEIPPFFICPISLQIMKDPVTLSTGISYDRESIDRWLFTYNHITCPVTKQPLTDRNLTPNSTLLRLIQSWRIQNSSKIISLVKSPRPTFDIDMFRKLVNEVREPQSHKIKALRKISSMIQENEDSRRYAEEAGLVSLMGFLITNKDPYEISQFSDGLSTTEEAMNVLYLLKPSPEALKRVSEDQHGKIIQVLSMVMQRGSNQARIHASLLLKSIFKVAHDIYKTGLKSELFDGLVEILKDHNSKRAAKAALSILLKVTQFRNNIVMAVEAGVVAVLVELLAEINERRRCEMMLRVLEIMCGRAEGREAFVVHPASVAPVSSKILTVSEEANESAVELLLKVCKFCGSGGVAEEMVEVGGAAKPLTDRNLTPNSTRLRLIQSWGIENSSKIISVVESPRPVFDIDMFRRLVNEVREPHSHKIKALRKISSMIQENDDSNRYDEEAGLVSLMAFLITNKDPYEISQFSNGLSATEEGMNVLYLLKPSPKALERPEALERLSEDQHGKIIQVLSMVMQRGSYQARIHASLLLKSIFKVVHDMYKTGLKSKLFDGLVEILKDHNSNRAPKAALSILLKVTQFRNNIAMAVEANLKHLVLYNLPFFFTILSFILFIVHNFIIPSFILFIILSFIFFIILGFIILSFIVFFIILSFIILSFILFIISALSSSASSSSSSSSAPSSSASFSLASSSAPPSPAAAVAASSPGGSSSSGFTGGKEEAAAATGGGGAEEDEDDEEEDEEDGAEDDEEDDGAEDDKAEDEAKEDEADDDEDDDEG